MSAVQVAEELGVSSAGVYLALKRLDIPRRGHKDAALNQGRTKRVPWKKVAKEYLRGATCDDLANKYGCANTTITYHLRGMGVSVRKAGESKKGKLAPRVHIDTDLAVKLNQEGKTLPEISDELGVSLGTLHYRLRSIGYKARSGLRARAAKHKNLQYHKRKVAAELEMSCAICGEDRTVDLSHIASAKNGHPMVKENAIVLCPTHHRLFDSGKLSKSEVKAIHSILREAAQNGYVNSFWGAL